MIAEEFLSKANERQKSIGGRLQNIPDDADPISYDENTSLEIDDIRRAFDRASTMIYVAEISGNTLSDQEEETLKTNIEILLNGVEDAVGEFERALQLA